MGLKGGIPTSKGRMGLVLDVGGYFKNVFTLAPAFDITDGEMDLGVEMLDWLIRKCK